jgi:rubrerythrin
MKGNKTGFCYECGDFPCGRLRHLDKRYQTKYHMSMIENLENIGKSGMRRFLKSEKAKWTCPFCGGTICVHRGSCSVCGKGMP